MAKDSRKRTSKTPLKKGGLGPFKIPDESHPIFTNPTTIGFGSPMGKSTPKPEAGSETSEEAQPDDGTDSTRKPSQKDWRVPMKFLDASDPIYSNPTVITFVRAKRSSPDSEIPEPGKPTSPEDSVGTED